MSQSRRTFLRAASAVPLLSVGCGSSAARTSAEVVVIGAGLAGLVTARLLAREGIDVLVLEARDRVGGRTWNQPNDEGWVIEAGGQWIGSTQTAILDLVRDLGLETFDVQVPGDVVYHFEGFRFRADAASMDAPTDEPARSDYLAARERFEALAATIPLDAPWTAPGAADLDGQTVGDWLRETTRTAEARETFAFEVATTLSASVDQVSLLWYASYAASAGGLESLTRRAEELRVRGGAQAISLRLADELADRVLIGTAVSEVAADDSGVTLETTRGPIRADRVVIAMMPADVEGIRFAPELSVDRRQLQQQWGVGMGMKTHVVYASPFWRERGESGTAIGDLPGVGFTVDNTSPGSPAGVLLAFTEPSELPADAAARRGRVLEELVRYFGEDARSPIGYFEHDWATDRWTAGCVSPLGPGVLSSVGAALVAPEGRIHWAGSETASIWRGYMEGAV
ncbi:MAG: FAD-dependent oxidoreductase, partial [Myxococcota bacterium]